MTYCVRVVIPGYTLRVGDPFPAEYRSDDGSSCWEIGPPRPVVGYACGRPPGHRGRHVAPDFDGRVCDIWEAS